MTLSSDSVGLSTEGLARVDEHLREYVESGRLAGCVTLAAQRGRPIHLAALGFADRERQIPMQLDTIFRIYSMSKPVTSVALMQLYERGRVQLDDPVSKYIRSWSNLRVYEAGAYPELRTRPAERPMTVHDLLTHQSGLAYGRTSDDSPVDKAYRAAGVLDLHEPLEAMVAKIASLPLVFSPGTSWRYSIATDVCGYLIQLIADQPFDEYLDEHIFEPLGMCDTGFWVAPGKISRLAENYGPTVSGGIETIGDPQANTYHSKPATPSGGGGLASTAADYWRFAQALCNGGEWDGHRLIGRKTLELMASNHLAGGADLASVALGRYSETTYQGIGFGLGFSVTLDPVTARLSGSARRILMGRRCEHDVLR